MLARRAGGGRLPGDHGPRRCGAPTRVVIATGHCDAPLVPALAARLPADVVAGGPDRLPQPRPAARRRRPRGRRLGDRRPARGRDPPLGPAGDARGGAARPHAPALPRAGHDVRGWTPRASSTRRRRRCATSRRARASRRSSSSAGPIGRTLDLGVLPMRGVRLVGRVAGRRGRPRALRGRPRPRRRGGRARLARLLGADRRARRARPVRRRRRRRSRSARSLPPAAPTAHRSRRRGRSGP